MFNMCLLKAAVSPLFNVDPIGGCGDGSHKEHAPNGDNHGCSCQGRHMAVLYLNKYTGRFSDWEKDFKVEESPCQDFPRAVLKRKVAERCQLPVLGPWVSPQCQLLS